MRTAPTHAAQTSPAPAHPTADVFTGLGAWVDVFDAGTLAPGPAVADLRAHEVRTLFLGTGRYNRVADVDPAAGRWLDAAHAAGVRVVGWYAPNYVDESRDLRGTVAIDRYRSPHGERFDGIAVDIEYPLAVASPAAWNAAVARQLAEVRTETDLPLGAIVLPPVLQQAWPDPARFAGFPWPTIARTAQAVLVMDYWTSYTAAHRCPTDPAFCPEQYTSANVARSHELTGLPVHVIGGVADAASGGDVVAFVAASSGAIGRSLYDYGTTTAGQWRELSSFARR